MADVFVSYKAEDRRRVEPLVQALQAEGLSVWWDEHIGVGDTWRDTIERQLNEAKTVVVVWSKKSVGPGGGFVREEATRAQKRGVYVPVLIDAVMPPLGFGESQATSLKNWHGNRADPRYRAFLKAIWRICGCVPSSAKQDTQRASLVTRRTAIAGGAAATAAVAGVGGWAIFRNGSSGSASDSIAVLPFENLSGDPGQAYFSSGIAEEIRSALSRIAGLKVAGSTSSEAVRNDDAKTVATKLAVANILTGSVRQSASLIRITAELIDGSTGLDKWSQSYDRSPGDAIRIQTDIAANVASALSAALGHGQCGGARPLPESPRPISRRRQRRQFAEGSWAARFRDDARSRLCGCHVVQSDRAHQPEWILLEWHGPVRTGFRASRRCRASGNCAGALPRVSPSGLGDCYVLAAECRRRRARIRARTRACWQRRRRPPDLR